MERVQVVYRGKPIDIPLPRGSETTWAELQALFHAELDVEVDVQRVFYDKKRVDPSDSTLTLAELGWNPTSNPRVLVIAGASREQIERLKAIREKAESQQQIRERRQIVSIGKLNRQYRARQSQSTDYRFHAIEVLENFSDAEKARQILERLANDKGVLAVMAKHRWSVGCLAEMYPDGKVGVDPVCVLGLNKNKGEKILLRLRTDDLLGFRKFLSIKKVLFHELSHNVYSEHDSQFYQLMRQVERECDELDWTHTSGYTVGGPLGTAVIRDWDHENLSVSGGRLGGTSTVSRLLQDQSVTPSGENFPQHEVEGHVHNSADSPTGTEIHTGPDEYQENRAMPEPPTTQGQQKLSQAALVDESFTEFEPSEREIRIRRTLEGLRSRIAGDAAVKAVTMLHKIVHNILEHPTDPKYRSVRKQNRLFETHVAWIPECLEFLQVIGFVDAGERLTLVRDDPGLLWIGRSTLEQLLPVQS